MGVMLLVILAVLVYALERNRRRQPYPGETRAGRAGVPDRDLERLRAELRAVSDRES